MVTQPSSPRQPSFPAGFSFPAARRRCPRRSSATCATRCLRRSSSPATCSAPRTRSRRATASAGSWRAMRCARSQALGIAEIKMGKGGGARVARGNPRLFAEALAVQLDLTGVSAAEIMDAQRAIECLAAELAAENATDEDIARLRQLDRRRRSEPRRRRALHRAWRRIPSRRGRGLAQPRAGGAAHLAAARVVAAAQSDADAEGGAAHPRRSQGAARR